MVIGLSILSVLAAPGGCSAAGAGLVESVGGPGAAGDSLASPATTPVATGQGILRGRVRNATTAEALRSAYIRLIPAGGGDSFLESTDANGLFGRQVPAGTWDVVVSYLLWPDKTLAAVEVRPDETVTLDIALAEKETVTIEGDVVDGVTPAERVARAAITFTPLLGGDPIGLYSDTNGHFKIDLPADVYEVRAMALTYDERRLRRVAVGPGQPTRLRIEMLPKAAVAVKEIVVQGDRIRSTKVSELQTRRQAAAVTDGITRETIRKGVDNDAAQVLGRVTGVSVKDGKFLVVRGMSERYASTRVNGVRVGSPENNRKVVPMDLFPASLLDNVVIQKTWSPDLPGDFGGASVQLTTRDIPEKTIVSLSGGAGYREGTTGRDGLVYDGGRLDFLGIDDGGRDLPDLIDNMAGSQKIVRKSPLQPNGPGFTDDVYNRLARSFNPQWGVAPRSQSPNSSWNAAFGGRRELFGRPLGLVTALAYNSSRSSEQNHLVDYESNDLATVAGDFNIHKTTQSILWGGIGNLSYRPGPNSSLKGNFLYTRSSDNEARLYQGYDNDYGTDIRSERLRFETRDLMSLALSGDHRLPILTSRLEWKLNRSTASRSEPDRRESFSEKIEQQIVDEGEDGSTVRDTTFWAFSRRGADRLFSGQDHQERGYDASWTIPFRSWTSGEARLRLGTARQSKDRHAWTRRFLYMSRGGRQYTGPVDSVLANSQVNTAIAFSENTRGTDFVWMDESVDAWFAMVDLPLIRRLRLAGGARYESSVQGVEYYKDDVFVSDRERFEHHEKDWLPGFNLTWAFGERANLRGSWSRTLNRPDLRELSPTAFTEYESGGSSIGNPDLRRARIESYDLRCEYFPTPGELVSISFFHKRLTDAIERYIEGGENPRNRPVNTKEGRNRGMEMEARLGLGRFVHPLDRFSFGGNLTLVDSEVQFATRVGVETSTHRPLADQSPWVGNAALFYTSPGSWTELSLYYNAFGRRLTDVGIYGAPDIYEQARRSVDMAWTQRLSRGLKLKFTGKNLTDTPVRKKQGDAFREDYRTGSAFSLSFTVGD